MSQDGPGAWRINAALSKAGCAAGWTIWGRFWTVLLSIRMMVAMTPHHRPLTVDEQAAGGQRSDGNVFGTGMGSVVEDVSAAAAAAARGRLRQSAALVLPAPWCATNSVGRCRERLSPPPPTVTLPAPVSVLADDLDSTIQAAWLPASGRCGKCLMTVPAASCSADGL